MADPSTDAQRSRSAAKRKLVEAQRNKVIATNRVARRDFEIVDEMEVGIVLTGSEVKALRESHARLNEAFGRVVRDELWIIGLHIPAYSLARGFGSHDPDRQRKLLAHRREIERWASLADQQRLTMVPLQMYFKEGRVKLLLGLGRGRRNYDKRQALAKRDADMEARRALAAGRRGGG
ncbi:MAG: SsrA-binding protein SmpB [Acidimicrobiia bacterium]|nr:SsrA-binding protein SmpB [Acidimicrobiia bacterium]